MKIVIHLFLFLSISCGAFAQTQPKPVKTTPAAPAVPDCSKVQIDSLVEGYKVNAIQMNEQKIAIKILVEDIGDTKEAFTLAAAEVLNQLYPGKFEVTSKADLVFYISGSEGKATETQSYKLAIYQLVRQPVLRGEKLGSYFGHFVFIEDGGWFRGSIAYRTQIFKQDAYAAVGKFLEKLENQ
jgi:hypothetical protein